MSPKAEKGDWVLEISTHSTWPCWASKGGGLSTMWDLFVLGF